MHQRSPAVCRHTDIVYLRPPTHPRTLHELLRRLFAGPGAGLNNLDSSGYALDAYPLSQLNQGRIRYAIADLTINPGGITGLARPDCAWNDRHWRDAQRQYARRDQ